MKKRIISVLMIFLILLSNIPNTFAQEEKCIIISSLIKNYFEPVIKTSLDTSKISQKGFEEFILKSNKGLNSASATLEEKQKIALLNLIILTQATDLIFDSEKKNNLINMFSLFTNEQQLDNILQNYIKELTERRINNKLDVFAVTILDFLQQDDILETLISAQEDLFEVIVEETITEETIIDNILINDLIKYGEAPEIFTNEKINELINKFSELDKDNVLLLIENYPDKIHQIIRGLNQLSQAEQIDIYAKSNLKEMADDFIARIIEINSPDLNLEQKFVDDLTKLFESKPDLKNLFSEIVIFKDNPPDRQKLIELNKKVTDYFQDIAEPFDARIKEILGPEAKLNFKGLVPWISDFDRDKYALILDFDISLDGISLFDSLSLKLLYDKDTEEIEGMFYNVFVRKNLRDLGLRGLGSVATHFRTLLLSVLNINKVVLDGESDGRYHWGTTNFYYFTEPEKIAEKYSQLTGTNLDLLDVDKKDPLTYPDLDELKKVLQNEDKVPYEFYISEIPTRALKILKRQITKIKQENEPEQISYLITETLSGFLRPTIYPMNDLLDDSKNQKLLDIFKLNNQQKNEFNQLLAEVKENLETAEEISLKKTPYPLIETSDGNYVLEDKNLILEDLEFLGQGVSGIAYDSRIGNDAVVIKTNLKDQDSLLEEARKTKKLTDFGLTNVVEYKGMFEENGNIKGFVEEKASGHPLLNFLQYVKRFKKLVEEVEDNEETKQKIRNMDKQARKDFFNTDILDYLRQTVKDEDRLEYFEYLIQEMPLKIYDDIGKEIALLELTKLVTDSTKELWNKGAAHGDVENFNNIFIDVDENDDFNLKFIDFGFTEFRDEDKDKFSVALKNDMRGLSSLFGDIESYVSFEDLDPIEMNVQDLYTQIQNNLKTLEQEIQTEESLLTPDEFGKIQEDEWTVLYEKEIEGQKKPVRFLKNDLEDLILEESYKTYKEGELTKLLQTTRAGQKFSTDYVTPLFRTEESFSNFLDNNYHQAFFFKYFKDQNILEKMVYSLSDQYNLFYDSALGIGIVYDDMDTALNQEPDFDLKRVMSYPFQNYQSFKETYETKAPLKETALTLVKNDDGSYILTDEILTIDEIKPLGMGNFGKVYTAKIANEDVIIKTSDRTYIGMLEREADITKKLTEMGFTNVMEYKDMFEENGNIKGFVAEFVEGFSLKRTLEEMRKFKENVQSAKQKITQSISEEQKIKYLKKGFESYVSKSKSESKISSRTERLLKLLIDDIGKDQLPLTLMNLYVDSVTDFWKKGVSHGDLSHLGNVFVTVDENNEFKLKFIDFGFTEFKEDNQKNFNRAVDRDYLGLTQIFINSDLDKEGMNRFYQFLSEQNKRMYKQAIQNKLNEIQEISVQVQVIAPEKTATVDVSKVKIIVPEEAEETQPMQYMGVLGGGFGTLGFATPAITPLATTVAGLGLFLYDLVAVRKEAEELGETVGFFEVKKQMKFYWSKWKQRFNKLLGREQIPLVKQQAEMLESPVLELEVEEDLPERGEVEQIKGAFEIEIDQGNELIDLINNFKQTRADSETYGELEQKLYEKSIKDKYGADKLPIFENKLSNSQYVLYEFSMSRDSMKSLNDISYSLGTEAMNAQHKILVEFAEQNNLPVSTLQKTGFLAIPTDSEISDEQIQELKSDLEKSIEEITQTDIKLNIGSSEVNPEDSLISGRLKTKRSLEYEKNKGTIERYDLDVEKWYNGLTLEEKVNVNDIFRGYDPALLVDFKELEALNSKTELTEQERARYETLLENLAKTDMQDKEFSAISIVKAYLSDSVTGIKEGELVFETDGISLGQKNKADVERLTKQLDNKELTEKEFAEQLGTKVDNNIASVNEQIRQVHDFAVDNIKTIDTETFNRYDQIAQETGFGKINDLNDLKEFLKYEFKNYGRFRGGDESFFAIRKIVIDSNPDIENIIQKVIKQCGENCGFEVRIGTKVVGVDESFKDSVAKADKAVQESKTRFFNNPVRIDEKGNTQVRQVSVQKIEPLVSETLESTFSEDFFTFEEDDGIMLNFLGLGSVWKFFTKNFKKRPITTITAGAILLSLAGVTPKITVPLLISGLGIINLKTTWKIISAPFRLPFKLLFGKQIRKYTWGTAAVITMFNLPSPIKEIALISTAGIYSLKQAPKLLKYFNKLPIEEQETKIIDTTEFKELITLSEEEMEQMLIERDILEETQEIDISQLETQEIDSEELQQFLDETQTKINQKAVTEKITQLISEKPTEKLTIKDKEELINELQDTIDDYILKFEEGVSFSELRKSNPVFFDAVENFFIFDLQNLLTRLLLTNKRFETGILFKLHFGEHRLFTYTLETLKELSNFIQNSDIKLDISINEKIKELENLENSADLYQIEKFYKNLEKDIDSELQLLTSKIEKKELILSSESFENYLAVLKNELLLSRLSGIIDDELDAKMINEIVNIEEKELISERPTEKIFPTELTVEEYLSRLEQETGDKGMTLYMDVFGFGILYDFMRTKGIPFVTQTFTNLFSAKPQQSIIDKSIFASDIKLAKTTLPEIPVEMREEKIYPLEKEILDEEKIRMFKNTTNEDEFINILVEITKQEQEKGMMLEQVIKQLLAEMQEKGIGPVIEEQSITFYYEKELRTITKDEFIKIIIEKLPTTKITQEYIEELKKLEAELIDLERQSQNKEFLEQIERSSTQGKFFGKQGMLYQPSGESFFEKQTNIIVTEESLRCEQGEKRDCYPADEKTLNLGICRSGLQECVELDLWGSCKGAITPTQEICDGLDNDCNGEVDENLDKYCYTGSLETENIGVCRAGLKQCIGGEWTECRGEVLPNEEICNLQDDNCNHIIDENCKTIITPFDSLSKYIFPEYTSEKEPEEGDQRYCYSASMETIDVGICKAGIQTFENGEWTDCIGEITPYAEQCNNQDDNCDGQIDNLERLCYDGEQKTDMVGICQRGIQVCTQGEWSDCYDQVVPTKEICDGWDNDCDGKIDDGCILVWKDDNFLIDNEEFYPCDDQMSSSVACCWSTKGKEVQTVRTYDFELYEKYVPEGFEIASQPFAVECDNDYVDITSMIPDNYDEVYLMRCRDQESNAKCEPLFIPEIIPHEGLTCYGYDVKSFAEKETEVKDYITPEIQKGNVVEKSFVMPGEIDYKHAKIIFPEINKRTTIVVKEIEKRIAYPRNNNLELTGGPMVVKIKEAQQLILPVNIEMKYLVADGINEQTINAYAITKTGWEKLDTIINQETTHAFVNIENIYPIMDENNEATIALFGIKCEACNKPIFKQAYEGTTRTAVILVPGLGGQATSFDAFVEEMKLTKQPNQIWTYEYPSEYDVDLASELLAKYIIANKEQFENIIFVGFSVGTLILQEALQKAEQIDDSFVDKTQKVILIAGPNEGTPIINVYDNLLNYLTNYKTYATLFEMNEEMAKDLLEGRIVPRLIGPEYYVLAGDESYDFNLGYFTISTEELFDYQPNDGIVSIKSAQRVGDEYIYDSCSNYFELPLTHTEMNDHELARETIGYVMNKEEKQSTEKPLIGQSQYARYPLFECKTGDIYYLIGKAIDDSMKSSVANCACGNGICGIDETELSCPQDCAEAKSWVEPKVLYFGAITAILVLIGFLIFYLRRKKKKYF